MMLIPLQRQPEERQGAIPWLLACHQRIRHFTALAQRLSVSLEATQEEVKEVAEGVHRYFHIALPLHEQDEERSLLPRLLGQDPALAQALAQMQAEHRQIDAVLSMMLPILEELIQAPYQHATLASALQSHAAHLESLWQPHLSMEEDIIFAAAEGSLDDQTKESLMQEMKARRSPRP